MSKNTGGPAFPTNHRDDPRAMPSEGMTLRDYFAAKVIQGWCTQFDLVGERYSTKAKYAYKLADAMLKAREE